MKFHLITFTLIVAVFFACSAPKENTAEQATVETEAVTELAEWEVEHQLFRPGYADSVNMGLMADDSFKGSSRRETTGTVAGNEVTVNYGSPGKRGRVLWNGLVSYDQVWVSGSHWATAVTFEKPVKINETIIPAGMYAFFTIPGTEEWELILNKNFDQHLADEYDKAEDVARVTVTPEMLPEVTERLTYEVVEKEEGQGEITMAWDQIKVALPFETVDAP